MNTEQKRRTRRYDECEATISGLHSYNWRTHGRKIPGRQPAQQPKILRVLRCLCWKQPLNREEVIAQLKAYTDEQDRQREAARALGTAKRMESENADRLPGF